MVTFSMTLNDLQKIKIETNKFDFDFLRSFEVIENGTIRKQATVSYSHFTAVGPICSRFDTIHERDGQTAIATTAKAALMHYFSFAASRDNNR